jgi:hypothetical protein
MGLLDIAFPYRKKKAFGAASFALIFVTLVVEVEALVFIALAIVAHRLDLFLDLQALIVPGACLVSLAAATVFWWRARRWTKDRVDTLNAWATGGTTYGERLASKRTR